MITPSKSSIRGHITLLIVNLDLAFLNPFERVSQMITKLVITTKWLKFPKVFHRQSIPIEIEAETFNDVR
jgi:hypothetical protein